MVVTLPLAILATTTLLGCRPDCPSFEQVQVDDPQGLLVPAARQGIQEALDDFAAWTDRDGVCVPSVRVVDDRGHWWAGYYLRPGAPIRVGPYPTRSYDLTLHELCHAIDEVEGIVDQHPRHFHEGLIEDGRYWTPALRRAEGFAQLCDDGPVDAALRRRLAQECGIGMALLPQRELLQEQVFAGVEALPWDAPTWEGAPRPAVWLADLDADWTTLSDRLALPGQELVLARPASPGRERPDGILLLALDPQTGAASPVARLDPGDLALDALAGAGFTLLPGDAGLLALSDAPGRPGWRLDPQSGTSVRLPWSSPPRTSRWALAELGGRLLVQEADDRWAVALLDPKTGEAQAVPWARDLLVERVVVDLEGAWLWAWEEGLLRLSADGTLSVAVTLPAGVEARDALPLADGRWAVQVTALDADDQPRAAVVLTDPLAADPTSRWATPADLCGQVHDPGAWRLSPTPDGIGLSDGRRQVALGAPHGR